MDIELDAKEKEIETLRRQLAKAKKGVSRRINGELTRLSSSTYSRWLMSLLDSRARRRRRIR